MSIPISSPPPAQPTGLGGMAQRARAWWELVVTLLCSAVGMLQLEWDLHIPRLFQLCPRLAEALTRLLLGGGHEFAPCPRRCPTLAVIHW